MTWLVFGVSCLLVLAGAVSIISGAPIIQLERGWAEVISGTVAVSSGGVVFALAGILMRLEAIRDAMAARALPVAAESLVAPAPVASAVEAMPPVPPAGPEPLTPPPLARRESTPQPEPEPVPEPAQAGPEVNQALWKRVKRPPAGRPDVSDLRQHGFPDRVVPDERDDAPKGEAPVVVPAHAVPPAPTPSDPAPPVAATSRDPVPPTVEAGQIGWLERSLLKGRPPHSGEDAVPPRAEPTIGASLPERGPDRIEPSAEPAAPARPGAPSLPVAVPKAAAEPDPTPDLASEQHAGATVVGRYQAGSASYVMYSDGTIEVETESGEMHRFGSMDELKTFIAQQDTPVA